MKDEDYKRISERPNKKLPSTVEEQRQRDQQEREQYQNGRDKDHDLHRSHPCPLGVVLNPFWLKVACWCLAGVGSVGLYGITTGLGFAHATETALQAHQLVIDQVQKADLANRVVKIEVVQAMQTNTQDRLEVKVDKLVEALGLPNPAPKPPAPITAPILPTTTSTTTTPTTTSTNTNTTTTTLTTP